MCYDDSSPTKAYKNTFRETKINAFKVIDKHRTRAKRNEYKKVSPWAEGATIFNYFIFMIFSFVSYEMQNALKHLKKMLF